MFGFGSSRTIVGLDIGSSSIKAVELKKVKGEIQVAHLGMERLGSDIVVDSMIVDSGSVSSAISKLFSERKFGSKLVATAGASWLFYLASVGQGYEWGTLVRGAFDLYRRPVLQSLGFTELPEDLEMIWAACGGAPSDWKLALAPLASL